MAPVEQNGSTAVDELADKLKACGFEPKDENERATVNAMRAMDDQYMESKKEFDQKVLEIELEYRKQWSALINKRTDLLKEKKINGFWLQVLKNCDATGDSIEEWDEPILEHLEQISFEHLDTAGKEGFKLIMEFSENDYFENTKITKTYKTEIVDPYSNEVDIMEIQCDELKWKQHKNVTVEVKQVKKKQGRKGKPKVVNQEVPRHSFFRTFFKALTPDTEVTDIEDEESDEEDDDEFNKAEMMMQDDWETGCELRDVVIPHAVRFYTGEACDFDDEESDSDAESNDEEDDISDFSDSESPSPKKGGKKQAAPKVGPNGEQQECKQQ